MQVAEALGFRVHQLDHHFNIEKGAGRAGWNAFKKMHSPK
jgi:hypothetical protein